MSQDEGFAKPATFASLNLAQMSVDELRARIDQLRADIAQCESMIAHKQGARVLAESLFKSDA